LTFDDGPHRELTPRLLEILARYGALATFFMVGKAAAEHRDIVRKVAEAGHAIGNHSWDHPSFPLITGKQRRAQIRACAEALSPYGAKLFRPPFGHQNTLSCLTARMLGYEIVTWGLHVEDWVPHDSPWIANRLIAKVRPGCIVLLHDRLFVRGKQYCSREPVLEALEVFLRQTAGRFTFVTIPALLQHGRPRRQNWLMAPDLDLINSLSAGD
jgi:peptidoglycan/xylan/chitin deacetylase (PgdA/CDA1 family)